MNPEVKEKWLSELRSGNYFQSKSYLKTESGGVPRHCCLGVLCEVAVESGLDISVEKADETYEFDGYDSSLSLKVQEWAGIDGGLGDFYLTGESINLAFLNDGGTSFAEIADIIERHF